MKKKIGVYAGSFDPITNGHMNCIQQALDLVDKLIVAIGTNPAKKNYFSADYKHLLINHSLQESLDESELKRVRVMHTGKSLLVDFAAAQGATHLFRGLRNAQDYAYERNMAVVNERLKPGVQTVFLHTHPDYAEISSSVVREFVGFDGWESSVRHWVPTPVMTALQQRVKK